MNKQILLLYFIINLVSFSIFAADKLKAIYNKWRISENNLILISAFAPIGAILAIFFLRHKIRDIKFTILIPIFIMIHIFLFMKGDIL